MSRRFHALAMTAVLAATMAVAPPARAQAPTPEPPNPQAPAPDTPNEPLKPPEPPAELPRLHGNTTLSIDKLFEALKIAPTDESAKFVENRIWAAWLAAGGDTANLLMGRVKTAL